MNAIEDLCIPYSLIVFNINLMLPKTTFSRIAMNILKYNPNKITLHQKGNDSTSHQTCITTPK